jgi:SAM-dependent methyltransferase
MNEIRPEQILKQAQGFMESRILLSAAELNLFSILQPAPLSARETAARVGADVRALTFLLDALVAMDLLFKKGQSYQCLRPVSHLLVEDSPASVLPMILHACSLWKRWSHLTDIVRGNNASKEEFDFSRNWEELRAFIGAMHVVATPMARKMVALVNPSYSKSLLDVGCGSGSYTIAFLQAVRGMKATLFDLPEVIEMARDRLREEGLLDRTTLVAGDFHRQEFPTGHDLALISAIIHSNSPEENQQLYAKVFRSLNRGGRILIRDHIMKPDRTGPRDGTVFAINMLVGTSGGGTYTYEEIASGLSKAGFTRVRLINKGEHMDGLVEGFKP